MQSNVALCITAFCLILLLGGKDPGTAATGVVDSVVHDFGVVSTGSEVRHAFPVKNKGLRPLEIADGSTSDSCVQILSHPWEILPGETGRVEISWIPSEPGEASHEIILETGDRPRSPMRFRLKGTVQEGSSPGESASNALDLRGSCLTRILRKPDPSLLVPVDVLSREVRKKTDILPVDVRDLADFERCRVPGSLHLPLFSIKTKGFLESKPLVLIGKGSDYGRLESECRHLRSQGFTVSVLDGGIQAWKAGGQPLDGNGCADEPLNTLSARELFEARHDETWLMVNACRSKRGDGRQCLPQAHLLPHPEKPDEVLAQLRTIRGNHGGGEPVTLLLFDDDGNQIPSLARVLLKSEMHRVFFLEGGIESYRAFLESQAALLDAHRNSTKKATEKCTSCP